MYDDPGYGLYGTTGYVANFQSLGHYFTTKVNRTREMVSIMDGTSTTIFLAEKMTTCLKATGGQPPPYYTIWAYGRTKWKEWNPVFAYQITGPASKFQVSPKFKGDGMNCNPRLASAPRPAGILVGMGDGSCRLVASSVTPETWWAACTPDSGEILSGDW